MVSSRSGAFGSLHLDDWKAVTHHRPGDRHEGDQWLYCLDVDFSEAHDLDQVEPERLEQMIKLWWSEAYKHQVLPVDDRRGERMAIPKVATQRREFVFFPGAAPPLRNSAPDFRSRSNEIRAEIDQPTTTSPGRITAHGRQAGAERRP
jgi:hypothetical protein